MLFVGVLVVLLAEIGPMVRAVTPFANDWGPDAAGVLRVLVGIALIAGAILLMVISFTSLTLALGSPLYDKISESVEAEFGDVPVLAEPVSRGVRRAVRQALALIAFSAPVAVLLFLAGFIPAHRPDRGAGGLGDVRWLDTGDRAGRRAVRAARNAPAG